MSYERQVTLQMGICRYGMVSVRIQRIVDRITCFRTKSKVVLNYWSAPSVCKDAIILRNKAAERIPSISFDTSEGRRCIHIPEGDLCLPGFAVNDFTLEILVISTDAAVLYDQ